MPEPSVDAIRHALNTAVNHGFSEVELEMGDARFEAKLGKFVKKIATHNIENRQIPEETEADPFKEITAPLVGYYQASAPPLSVGQTVTKGDIVAVITALGLANDLEAGVSGEVVDVLVSPGQSVEFGQVLARVKSVA